MLRHQSKAADGSAVGGRVAVTSTECCAINRRRLTEARSAAELP
jgi:hypothetical protein